MYLRTQLGENAPYSAHCNSPMSIHERSGEIRSGTEGTDMRERA
jgi:hypothetical protein